MLQDGDSLEFLFSSSFANYAAGMGMPPYPRVVTFMFASMPVNMTGQFTAEIESAGGTALAAFPGSIGWTSGYAQNSGYSGPISALMDAISFSSPVSQAIFAGSEAELILTYTGPDVTVGVQGRSLRQDLIVSLSGGALSMSGMVYSEALGHIRITTGRTAAAEPDSAALLVMAEASMCALAAALKRVRLQGRSG
jgi:hypothetical protein